MGKMHLSEAEAMEDYVTGRTAFLTLVTNVTAFSITSLYFSFIGDFTGRLVTSGYRLQVGCRHFSKEADRTHE
jgi:hypothetical protein